MSTAQFDILKLLRRNQPRQPWDERLPSGETVPDLFRRSTGNSNTLESRTGEAEGIAPPRPTTSPAIQRAALGVPDGNLVDLLKRPAPITPTGTPPPPNEDRRVPEQPLPQVRVGTSTTGMSPTDQQQSYVDLLRRAPASSKVSQRDGFVEEGPPEQSPSRVKNALLGLLLGMGQGGIGGGIGGAALGAIKPGAIQQLLRDQQIAKEEGQLERQVGIEGKRADTDYRKRAAERLGIPEPPKSDERVLNAGEYPNLPAGTIINRVWNSEKKQWEDEIQNSKPVISKSAAAAPRGDTRYFERDEGVYRIGAEGQGEIVPGIPGKPPSTAQDAQAAEGEAIAESTQQAADALKGELDQHKTQLTTNEKAIREKEAIWRTEAQRRYDEIHKKEIVKGSDGIERLTDLNSDDERKLKDFIEEAKAADPDYQKGVYDETVENTKRLRDALGDKQKQFDSMQREIREGKAKGARRRGSQSTATQPYAGRTMSQANLAKYAKDKGLTVEEARKQVEAQGVRVQ